MYTPFHHAARATGEPSGRSRFRFAPSPAGVGAVALGGAASTTSTWGSYAGPATASAATPAPAVRGRGRIVLAGGDAAQGLMIGRTLEGDGFDVAPAAKGRDAVVSLITEPADVLLVNAPLSDGSAAALVRWVRARPVSAGMTCIVICPAHDTTTVAGLYDAGADVVITRRTELDLLSRKVAAALARRPLALAS